MRIKLYHITRVLYLFSKLLPIIFLPQYLSPEEIGTYGVVMGYVYLFIFIVGYESWYLYNRKISAIKNKKRISFYIKKQFSIYLPTYILSLPVIYWLTNDVGYGFMSIILLFLLHYSQEISKILIAREDHISSSIIQLMQVVWVFMLPLGKVTDSHTLLLYFTISAFISFIYSLFCLSSKHGIQMFSITPKVLSLNKYFEAWRFLSLMVISAISGKLLIYIPRFVLENESLMSEVGLISYYYSIVSVVSYFSFYFVQSIYIPKLIKSSSPELEIIERKFWSFNWFISLSLYLLMSLIGFIYFKYFISNSLYFENYWVYFIYLTATTVTSLSCYYSTALYIRKLDKEYRNSVIISAILSLTFIYIGIHVFNENLIFNILVYGYLFQSLVLYTLRWYYFVKGK